MIPLTLTLVTPQHVYDELKWGWGYSFPVRRLRALTTSSVTRLRNSEWKDKPLTQEMFVSPPDTLFPRCGSLVGGKVRAYTHTPTVTEDPHGVRVRQGGPRVLRRSPKGHTAPLPHPVEVEVIGCVGNGKSVYLLLALRLWRFVSMSPFQVETQRAISIHAGEPQVARGHSPRLLYNPDPCETPDSSREEGPVLLFHPKVGPDLRLVPSHLSQTHRAFRGSRRYCPPVFGPPDFDVQRGEGWDLRLQTLPP